MAIVSKKMQEWFVAIIKGDVLQMKMSIIYIAVIMNICVLGCQHNLDNPKYAETEKLLKSHVTKKLLYTTKDDNEFVSLLFSSFYAEKKRWPYSVDEFQEYAQTNKMDDCCSRTAIQNIIGSKLEVLQSGDLRIVNDKQKNIITIKNPKGIEIP